MAGVKGRSGSGGARPGAGRKPKAKPVVVEFVQTGPVQGDRDMLQLLQDVALGRVAVTALQVRAAIAAVQYTHTKKGDGGIKDERAGNAKKAAAGKFAAAQPPKLVAANGRKI